VPVTGSVSSPCCSSRIGSAADGFLLALRCSAYMSPMQLVVRSRSTQISPSWRTHKIDKGRTADRLRYRPAKKNVTLPLPETSQVRRTVVDSSRVKRNVRNILLRSDNLTATVRFRFICYVAWRVWVGSFELCAVFCIAQLAELFI